MKFWLIVFLFTADGEFQGKLEHVYDNAELCAVAAADVSLQYINSGTGLATFCVSDDHHSGRAQDENTPYDF